MRASPEGGWKSHRAVYLHPHFVVAKQVIPEWGKAKDEGRSFSSHQEEGQ
jgi:hypothetical protein